MSICFHKKRQLNPYNLSVNLVNLGNLIRSERQKKGYSLRDLADLCSDASFDTIRRIEAAETPNPGLATLLSIAKALRIPLFDLIKAYQGQDPDLAEPLKPDEEPLKELAARVLADAAIMQKRIEKLLAEDKQQK